MRIGSKPPSPARLLIAHADAARDAGRHRDAAALYAEALILEPGNAGIHVQAGHMFKEAGEYDRAAPHYDRAAALLPDAAEVALQLGHFHKVAGRLLDAWEQYGRAARLRPGWAEPEAEREGMRRSGWRDPSEAATEPASDAASVSEGEGGLHLAALYGRMAPENLPKPFSAMLHYGEDSINLRQFGVGMNTYWGMKPVLRGVEAIRGFCISAVPVSTVEARVNGLPIHRGPLKGPFELEYEPDKGRIHKYVFNIWCDLSDFADGLYELELSFFDGGRRITFAREEFVVERPLLEADHPASDGVINLDPDGHGSIEQQIAARPSAIHEAARPDMLPEVRSVLVTRADQLGDLVASIPGILRLRELFPDARLVGLFSPANVELARTLRVFDDVEVVDFRESLYQRTRTLTLAEQAELRDRLLPYRFDLAIDLSQSLMSRPLLGLSGAKFTYGFKDPNWPRLTASVDDAYHDPKNHREVATHSTRIVAMVERLRALMASSARVIRRDDVPRDALRAYGLGPDDRYAVLHTGARIVFSRWPHYLELAARLHADTDLKIVLFTGDPDLRAKLPAGISGSDRIVVIDGQLPFDGFDALLHFCSVYVGNDSGPKHLASLRGVPVVSIHSARINWSEWGQEHTGVIVTRKVPCAGCTLYHDVDECGKDYVCVNGIPLDDVYRAVRRYV